MQNVFANSRKYPRGKEMALGSGCGNYRHSSAKARTGRGRVQEKGGRPKRNGKVKAKTGASRRYDCVPSERC